MRIYTKRGFTSGHSSYAAGMYFEVTAEDGDAFVSDGSAFYATDDNEIADGQEDFSADPTVFVEPQKSGAGNSILTHDSFTALYEPQDSAGGGEIESRDPDFIPEDIDNG